MTDEKQRFGAFGYPVAIIDREAPEDGAFLIRDDEELRAHILEDYSYMRDDPEPGSNDKALYDAFKHLALDDLLNEYLDSDNMLIPIYMPDPLESKDSAFEQAMQEAEEIAEEDLTAAADMYDRLSLGEDPTGILAVRDEHIAELRDA